MSNGLNLKRIFTGLALICWISPAHASLTGIPGYSLYETGASSCHACHTPPSSAPTNSLTIAGNTTVLTSSSSSYTLTLVAPYTQTATHGGFNLSTSNGVLSAADAETWVANNELVHATGKATTDTSSSYTVSWTFNWQAPAVTGTSTFYACALPVNGDGQATSTGHHGSGSGGHGNNGPDGFTRCTTFTIQTQQAPTANAGTNQTVVEGTTNVTLDGSASSDDGTITSYQWQQLTGTSVTLNNPGTAIATFDAPQVTVTEQLDFQLTITDNDNNSSTDTVTIFVQNTGDTNTPPVASAGIDQNVNENTLVNLDGSASSDAEDTLPTSYLWEQTAGTSVTINNATTATASFTSPQVTPNGELLRFRLTVTDSQGLQATDNIDITVNNVDNPPAALITDLHGTAITAIANNSQITLYGNFSNDPDGPITAYSWQQTAGSAIINPGVTNSNQFSFTTPDNLGSTIDIQLTVTGNEPGIQNSITTTFTLNDFPPVVDAGLNQTYLEGETIYLDALITDPNNDVTSILWQQINCAASCITLPVDNQANISFTLPSITAAQSGMVLDFQVTATDAKGLSSQDTASITLIDNGITSYPDNSVSFYSDNSQPMALSVNTLDSINSASISVLQPISASTVTDNTNRPVSFPYELLDFEIQLSDPGSSVEITLFFPEAVPDDFSYYQYLSSNGWIDNSGTRDFNNLSYSASGWTETSEQVYFNADRTQVTITITDGGPSDADGLVNGVISYQSGVGEPPLNTKTQAGATGATSPLLVLLLALTQLVYRMGRSAGSPRN